MCRHGVMPRVTALKVGGFVSAAILSEMAVDAVPSGWAMTSRQAATGLGRRLRMNQG